MAAVILANRIKAELAQLKSINELMDVNIVGGMDTTSDTFAVQSREAKN